MVAAIKAIFKNFLWVIFKAGEIACFFGMIICLGLVPWKLEMTLFGLFPFDYTLRNFLMSIALIFIVCSLEKWICKMMLYIIEHGFIDEMFGGR